MTDIIEMHPLFVTDDEKELAEPIGVIYVHRFAKTGSMPCIDVVPADEITDEMQLRERYGPGSYVLVGRNLARSRILRRISIQVDAVDGSCGSSEAPPAPATPSAASPAAPGMGLAEMMFKSMLEMQQKFAERSEAHTATIVKAISDMSGARLADQRDMIAALAKGKEGGGGSAQYEKGLELGLSLAQVMTENAGGGDVAEIVQGFAQGMQAMNDLSKTNGGAGGAGGGGAS